MAQLKTSVAMQKQILELIEKKYCKREVARMLGVSKNTVKRVLRVHQCNIEQTNKSGPIWSQKLNWKQIYKENSRGITGDSWDCGQKRYLYVLALSGVLNGEEETSKASWTQDIC